MTRRTAGILAVAAVVVLVLGVGTAITIIMGGDDAEFGLDRPRDESREGEIVGAARRHGETAEPQPSTPESSPATIASRPPHQVDRTLDLFGLVTDPEGRAISGARVRALSNPWKRGGGLSVKGAADRLVRAATTTLPDGCYSLRLRRGDYVLLEVSADGFGTTEVAGCSAGQRRDVILEAEARALITCIDYRGKPAHDVSISYWRNTSTGVVDRRHGLTDADGRVTFQGLGSGTGTLICATANYGEPPWQTIEVESGKETEVEVLLPAGRFLRGLVRDAESSQPIPNARVGLGWAMRTETTTDETGLFEFPAYSGRRGRDIHVLAAGYGRQSKNAPETGELVFELSRGDTVSGSIVAASGEPIEGAYVQIIGTRFDSGSQQIDNGSTRSGRDGEFLLTDVRRDMPHTLMVAAEDHGRILLDFDPHPDEPGTIELGYIALPEPRRIEGKALGPNDEPLAGLRVVLVGHNDDRTRLRDGNSGVAQEYYGKRESRMTDDLGRFRFSDLAPGRYELTLVAGGRRDLRKTVHLREGEDHVDVDFRISDAGELAVRCVDPEGLAIAGVYVMARPLDNSNRTAGAATDASGVAHLKFLSRTRYEITASGKGDLGPPEPVVAKPGDGPILLRLPRPAVVDGRVLKPDGTPAARYELAVEVDVDVAINANAEKSSVHFTDEKGTFRFETDAGRDVTIRVTGARLENGTRGTVIPAGAVLVGEAHFSAPASGVTIVLAADETKETLDVLVVDAQGTPVRNANVEIGDGSTRGRTDSTGRARFVGLDRKDTRVRAFPPREDAGRLFPSEVTGIRSDTQEITLTLDSAVLLSGTVVDENESGMPDVILHFELSTRSTHVRTDRNGRFALPVAGPPPWRLHLIADGSRERSRIRTVSSADDDIVIEWD